VQRYKSCSTFHSPCFLPDVKLPVAYYLSGGSTKAEMLLQFLNGVLGACQNVGLHSVCDMGANNVKAMKLLGSTRNEPFFQFQNQAIATI